MIDHNPLYCSFCGKHQDEVKVILAGPCVFICDECVFISVDILDTEFKVINSEDRYRKAYEFLKCHDFVLFCRRRKLELMRNCWGHKRKDHGVINETRSI